MLWGYLWIERISMTCQAVLLQTDTRTREWTNGKIDVLSLEIIFLQITDISLHMHRRLLICGCGWMFCSETSSSGNCEELRVRAGWGLLLLLLSTKRARVNACHLSASALVCLCRPCTAVISYVAAVSVPVGPAAWRTHWTQPLIVYCLALLLHIPAISSVCRSIAV